MGCLLYLLVALLELGLSLLILRLCGIEARLSKSELRACLRRRLLARCLQSLCLVDLIHCDELLGEKRLNTMQIVGGVGGLSVGAIHSSLGVDYLRLRLVHGSGSASDVCFSAFSVSLRHVYGASEGRDGAALINDLAFKCCTLRFCLFQSVGIRALVDIKEQVSLLH